MHPFSHFHYRGALRPLSAGEAPHDSSALGLGGELIIRRVDDVLQGEPMGRSHRGRVIPGPRREQFAGPGGGPAPSPDSEPGPDQRAHHGMAECVGQDGDLDRPRGLVGSSAPRDIDGS